MIGVRRISIYIVNTAHIPDTAVSLHRGLVPTSWADHNPKPLNPKTSRVRFGAPGGEPRASSKLLFCLSRGACCVSRGRRRRRGGGVPGAGKYLSQLGNAVQLYGCLKLKKDKRLNNV